MKIKARKDIIESILINTQPFIERKDATNITSHLYFNAKDNIVTIKATDTKIGLMIKSEQFNIDEEGNFTANGKKLLDIVRTLKNDLIEFELNNEYIIIKQNKAKFKLPTFDYNEFPIFPKIENKNQITIDSLNLIKSLKKINPAIDNNNPKFELNGALIDIKEDKTFFVGTDTRRLAVVEVNIKSNQELDLIIPKKTIIEIQKLFLDKIDIYYDDTNIIIKNDQFFLFSRLINGKFPDYQRIIPKETKYNFTIDKKNMIEAMKIITTISNEIKIKFEKNLITLKSLNDTNQEAQTSFEANIDIEEPFNLAINSKYLLDFLSQIDDENFDIGLNETNLPFVVKNQNFLTVIMPIIL